MYNFCEFCNERKADGTLMAIYEHPQHNEIGWEDCTFCCIECHPEFFDKDGNVIKEPFITTER